MNRRQWIAAALLACAHDDLPPVLHAALRAFTVELHSAARGRHRHDRRDAQLDRLLDRIVHAIGGGEPLDQRYRQRRLTLDGQTFANAYADCAVVDAGELGEAFAALAIEQD